MIGRLSVCAAMLLLAGCAQQQSGGRDDVGEGGRGEFVRSAPEADLPGREEEHLARTSASDVSSYLCGHECDASGPFVASSEHEARWMIEHGYPNQARLNELEALDYSRLQQMADTGDRTAAVVLGRRIALERSLLDGQVILRNQALEGNMFAYYALSETGVNGEVPSPIDGAAYLRIAFMLGDYKAATKIAQMGLSSAELAAADKRALVLFKGFSGGKGTDPRPQE